MACDPLNITCQIQEAIVGLVMPIVLPLVLFLVLIFVVPKAGKKGVAVAIVGIFLLLLYYGLVPGLPGLR